MEALNNVQSRKVSASENMARLERAIAHSDQRFRIKREVNSRVTVALTLLFGLPLSAYLIHGWFAPSGVMQNYKASSGAYMDFTQRFIGQ